jgi:sulfate adenylyltransferase|tara:strand:+ start:50 stop:1114 length:1065 start_codon:yes stop_codon:yes gene_type:complete
MKLFYELNEDLLQDLINIRMELFYPLEGFMTSHDYHSTVENMCLGNGDIWTIPISLDIDHETFIKAVDSDTIFFTHKSKEIGYMTIEDSFKVDLYDDVMKVFNTKDTSHPGVNRELERYEYRLGGKTYITDPTVYNNALDPDVTKREFRNRGWKTVAGFQTRNPVHKAHEYSQRVALEICDGLFINPLVGWKKKGDFSEKAVISGYQAMIDNYYSDILIFFDVLKTPMRYAGPREAIFHAIIRRNLGCTHFIIGRDHAGVGNYYGKYEAHELAKSIIGKADLGITLLLISGPYYCQKCAQIVTSRTCGHEKEYIEEISGTKIREMLSRGVRPDERFMRKEVADSIIELEDSMFI